MSFPGEDAAAGWRPGAQFQTTLWSVVLAAGAAERTGAREALEKLCRCYWPPLYAYIRRRGYGPEDAEDLTQEFFQRLLEKDYLRLADQKRGRFRTFLLTSMQHFLINEWERQSALKRGGGQAQISWDRDAAEAFYLSEKSDQLSPEKIFERRWAVSLLEQVLSKLRQEYTRAGKAQLFDGLKDFLWGDTENASYAELAKGLAATEGALRVAMHRLRHRYRELLRAEIANTVADASEIEDEIRHLFEALA